MNDEKIDLRSKIVWTLFSNEQVVLHVMYEQISAPIYTSTEYRVSCTFTGIQCRR